jgi:SAM-dependent methyltransferase
MVDLVGRFAERSATAVPMGIEVSKALSAKANARFEPFGGLVVFASAIEGAHLVEDGSVDLIVMHSFLEHEARPKVLLEELRSTLTPDGLVALKVPNFACWNRVLRGGRWCGFRYPDHVNYFTPDTLRTLVETSGYQIVRQNFSDRFPLSDNMYAVLSVSQ